MLFLRTVLGTFIIGVASSLRNCDNCTKINECEEALKLLTANKLLATAALLIDASRDRQGENEKICCFSFRTRIQSNDVEGSSEDEIENHPNLHLLPKDCGPFEDSRIIGGTLPSLYEFPWMALISHRIKGVLKFYCSGSVINNRYVLTAAHCIQDHDIAGVRIGEYDTDTDIDCYGVDPNRICEDKIQDIFVFEKIIHHEYSGKSTNVNDIGLLRLNKSINLTYKNAAAICLPVFKEVRQKDLSTEIATVAGWGKTETQERSPVLLKVTIPIYSTENCKSYYYVRSGSKLCAGDSGRDSCNGDSGGPLMLKNLYNKTYRMVQFGVVSYGPIECGSNAPGVYTDVRKYMKWILDNIKP